LLRDQDGERVHVERPTLPLRAFGRKEQREDRWLGGVICSGRASRHLRRSNPSGTR
jgi:hypothetical protein